MEQVRRLKKTPQNITFLIICALLISFITVFYIEVAIIILWILIWLIILNIVLLKSAESDRNFLLPFIIVGLFISLAMAFLFKIRFTSTGGLISPDEFFYFNYAKDITNSWKTGSFIGLADIRALVDTANYGYHIYNAIHFLILEDKLLPVISNIFFHVISAILLFMISKEEFDLKVAKYVFLIALFNPYFIFFSTFLLKDVFLSFLIVCVLFCYYGLTRGKNPFLYSAVMVLLLLIILTLRWYIPLLLLGLAISSLLVSGKQYAQKKMLAIFTVLVLLLFFSTSCEPANRLMRRINNRGIVQVVKKRSSISVEKSKSQSFGANVEDMNVKSIVSSSITYLLLPNPFNIVYIRRYAGRLSGILFSFGTMIWYVLIIYSIVGFLILQKKRLFKHLLLILFPICCVILCGFFPSLTEPRHRLMIIPFTTIVACVGLVQKYRYKKLIILVAWIFIMTLIFMARVALI